jgi:hypothetical protein
MFPSKPGSIATGMVVNHARHASQNQAQGLELPHAAGLVVAVEGKKQAHFPGSSGHDGKYHRDNPGRS